MRSEAGLREISVALDGIVSANRIIVTDLEISRFVDAKLTEYLVDWMFPFIGSLATTVLWVGPMKFDGEQWEAEAVGIAARLQQPVGKVFASTCWWQLGESFGDAAVAGCKVNLAPLTFSSVNVDTHTDDRNFVCAVGVITGSLGVDYFADGKLTWQTGANTGVVSEVKTHPDSGTGAYAIELYVKTPFPIDDADTFKVEPGCDKLRSTCKDKFNNIKNHGGFDFAPSMDTLTGAPG